MGEQPGQPEYRPREPDGHSQQSISNTAGVLNNTGGFWHWPQGRETCINARFRQNADIRQGGRHQAVRQTSGREAGLLVITTLAGQNRNGYPAIVKPQ